MTDIFTGTRGFIFDCDGTLLDSMQAWNEAEDTLQRMANAPVSPEDATSIHALPIEESAALWHEKYGVGESAEDVLAIEDNVLLSFYRERVEVLPGVRTMLERAQEQGIPCCVVTSSPKRYVQAGLERWGLASFFAEICTTDELGMTKEETAIYEHAMATMGSTPETTWGFDDAVYAVNTMTRAGIRTVGAFDPNNTSHPFEDLQAAATVAVHSLEELL